MFACPHCQFENPIQNRFCQRCGNPLKGLRAVITRSSVPQLQATPSGQVASPSSAETASTPTTAPLEVTLADLLTEGRYLDPEKRYQVRQPLAVDQQLSEDLEVDIIDCQPAANSPLAELLTDHGARGDDATSLQALLPPLAYPYWKLQDQFFPVIPELQAAWQHQAFTIVVLEDRAAWKPLAEVCSSSEVEPLELIHWFYEVADLWEGLSAYQAEPSLLSQQNLLVDDDQILCLKRLLYRSGNRTYDLKDLGLLWQALLQQSPSHHLKALETLAQEMGSGAIASITTIKERLAQIADSLQGVVAAEAQQALTDNADDTDLELPVTLPGSAADCESDVPMPLEEEVLLAMEAAEAEMDTDIDDNLSDLPTMALPMTLYRLDEVGRTHVGRQRTHNEDSFYIQTWVNRSDSPAGATLQARGLYILCDGMGGHAGGEIASGLAVKTLRDYFAVHWQDDLPDEETIKAGILQANQAIFERNEAEGRTGSACMGTTLVMVLLANTQAVVAHVGDSRLYCLTRQGLQQTTTDHEVGQREIKRGVEPTIAYARPDAYQLTQALGPRSNQEVLPNISSLYIGQDTLLLLCSDGLSDNDLLETHSESHIRPLLRSRTDLDTGIDDLIDLANEHNGHDNITVIAVRIKVRPNLEALQGPQRAASSEKR